MEAKSRGCRKTPVRAGFLFASLLLAFCWLVPLSGLNARPEDEGRARVAEGIGHFERGDYEAAARAFAEADVALPGDPKVAYDRGCASQAEGDFDKAVGYYTAAALAREAAVAASARFNLGTVNVSKAMEIFGGQPSEATTEQRGEGIEILGRAVRHFRDCLEVDADHKAARHNLEGIRLWIKHMQALWKEKDRQQKRDELNVLEFLEMIQQAQIAIRAGVRSLAFESDSPRRREAVNVAEISQRTLFDEIAFLKEKITEALKPPPAQPGQPQPAASPAPSQEEIEKGLEMLHGFADEAGARMIEAADLLAGGSLEGAPESEWGAVERLDRIFDALASFDALVLKALGTQQGVVDGTLAFVDFSAGSDSGSISDSGSESGSDGDSGRENPPGMDAADVGLFQERVTGWADLMPLKAEHQEEQLNAAEGQAGPGVPGMPAGGTGQAGDAEAEAAKEQLENHRKACAKAREYAPRIRELSSEAAASLKDERPADALPKEEEALALLKEIAELLPKNDQQQQGGDQGEQKEDNKENQQQQEGDEKKKDEQEQQKQAEREKEKKDLSRREAEAVLRKAGEKERRHKEKEREIQEALRKKGGVEKDW
jgi:hypothetical protein